MSFIEKLEKRARQVDSLLCVGLDPHLEDLGDVGRNAIPSVGRNAVVGRNAIPPYARAARDFCLRLIEATTDLALAYKPNAAFFEAYGPEGWQALREVIRAVPAGIPVILDAKRGDIASTAEAYARAAFHTWGAQAVTVNPYLGYDALEPFLEDPEHGVFLLCKTSNPGAVDLQERQVYFETGEAGALYELVARLAVGWNHNNNLGLVVGATDPQALQQVRVIAPELWFLAPGIGAQGGELQAALAAGLRSDGLGMLLPVARSISRAADPRRAAQELRQAINHERNALLAQRATRRTAVKAGFTPELRALADGLLEAGCVRFGKFTLKSGLLSPIYLDLRLLPSHPNMLRRASAAYLPLLRALSFDRLAALPYAGLPIATAIGLLGGWPLIYPRKEAKSYGTQVEIEGEHRPGERAVVIDDLATTGGSKFEAIEKLASAGLQVEDVVVLIDRQSGASEALAEAGYRLHAVFTLSQLLDYWASAGSVAAEQIAATRVFLAEGNQRP